MNEGWVKLHRKFIDSPVFQSRDSHLVQLFLYCLLKANWKDKEAVLGNEVLLIKRGQFITGRKQLVRDLTALRRENSPMWQKMETLYRRKLFILEKLHFLTISPTNKYSIVTICNYEKYQANDQQMTNNRPTDDQQMTTTKNIKNIKNNNILPERSDDLPEKEVLEKLPNKNDLYRSIITYCREKQGISREYPNYVKQTTALKKIFGSGYSEPEVKFVIEEMSKDTFWQESPFDLMTVANQMHKYLNRTVLFKKGGQRAFN